MSAPARRPARRPGPRHLAVAPDVAELPGIVPASVPARPDRPAVLRLCAGEALVLGEDDIDFVDLVNASRDLVPVLLDDRVDPDEHRLAEVLVEYFCTHHGIHRHGKGDRLKGVISTYRRYLIPFLAELAASLPAEERGVAHLRLQHLERLPRMLAGQLPLPAATVAGDRLGRRAVGCVYLTLDDAARVVTGNGATTLQAAIGAGTVVVHRDARTGEQIVAAGDLRAAGILEESSRPRGLSANTAGNVLRDLKLAIERARDHGAHIRGTFRLKAIPPLPGERLRSPKPPSGRLTLSTVRDTAPNLPVIGQAVLWTARLVGERISEIYGIHVCDYVRDEDDRPWLAINKQGGISSLGRDPETGRFRRQDFKDHTKTPAGVRTIPIPRQLAALLDTIVAVFHTDPETGEVNLKARLIPGLQSEDTSGQSSFRGWLEQAQKLTGVAFTPHDLRDALITDLKDAGIDERLAHYYAGHEKPNATIQDKHYDLGPYPALLHPIADLLQKQISDELGTDDLRAPTTQREQWGRGTRRYRHADWIEQQLLACGWRLRNVDPVLGTALPTAAVAAALGKRLPRTRILMRTGAIPAHRRPLGQREVWVAFEADVRRYQDRASGVTVQHLAERVGLSYHQTWNLVRELGLVPAGHQKGTALRLAQQDADQVAREAERRTRVLADALSIKDAAAYLEMQVTTVETLIRQQQLTLTEGPDDTRRRYVTRSSVEDYQRRYPAPAHTEGDTGPLLTMTTTREILRVTRPQLTTLVATRQLHTGHKPGSRHVYITAASALAWAEKTGLPSAVASVKAIIGDAQ